MATYSGSARSFFAIIDLSSVFVATGLVMVSDTRISRIHFGWITHGASEGAAVSPSAASTSTNARARSGYRITSSVAAPAPKE